MRELYSMKFFSISFLQSCFPDEELMEEEIESIYVESPDEKLEEFLSDKDFKGIGKDLLKIMLREPKEEELDWMPAIREDKDVFLEAREDLNKNTYEPFSIFKVMSLVNNEE